MAAVQNLYSYANKAQCCWCFWVKIIQFVVPFSSRLEEDRSLSNRLEDWGLPFMFRGFTFRRLTLLLGCDLVGVCDDVHERISGKNHVLAKIRRKAFLWGSPWTAQMYACLFCLGTTSESHLGWFRVKSVRFSGFPWLQGNRSQEEGHFGKEHCAIRLCTVWIDEKLLPFPRI